MKCNGSVCTVRENTGEKKKQSERNMEVINVKKRKNKETKE